MVVDSLCDVPTGLHLSLANDEHTLSWSGNASSYEVTAFIDATQEWFGPYEISDTSYTFIDLPDAQIDFSVRAKCGDGTYSPKATLSQLVYHPDRMCFDYLNFNNASVTSIIPLLKIPVLLTISSKFLQSTMVRIIY